MISTVRKAQWPTKNLPAPSKGSNKNVPQDKEKAAVRHNKSKNVQRHPAKDGKTKPKERPSSPKNGPIPKLFLPFAPTWIKTSAPTP